MHDVLIVGGGPAGLHAARELARSGADVVVLEEHARVGEPVHCTGVLAAEAFEEFGIPDGSVLNALRTVDFHAPSGERVTHSTARTEAVVVDRARFDADLAQLAAGTGVTIRRGARATALDITPDRASVTVGDTQLHGRVCLLACGANYALQRRVGLGMPRLLLNTAQIEVPAARLRDVEVHFGSRVAPSGFGWAVPVQRDQPYVRVGLMCDGDAGRHFQRLMEAVAPRWGVDEAARLQPRQKVLPLAPLKQTFSDRVLVLGDAAGLVKPTTGGGIYYSLVSASTAAATVSAALARNDLSAASLADYQRGWRKRLGAELRWQLVLRRVAQRLSDAQIDSLFELARTDGLMPLLRHTAAFNHHREFIIALLKHPPARRVLFRAALA
ncbi:MAG TPA: NAD(P)/FAD-dependent oxidoreductase [Vicinamibacterales bacterium]|nr:NAD(P)/FAD-dependent oxidoreductase [Vicinamibacterales bacterium]